MILRQFKPILAKKSPEKGESQRVAERPTIDYQSLVPTLFFGCLKLKRKVYSKENQ